jgi:tripartite-type tricarboxylate transporter receptor subunit TctC
MKIPAGIVCALALLLGHVPAGLAQGYPAKPVRVILPQPAGQGPSDISTRIITQALGQVLGQPFINDNRAGANGIIGMEACSKAAPDGYTVCVTSASMLLFSPLFVARMPYDPVRSFVPVISLGLPSYALVATPSLPANTLREVFELARAKPDTITWGTFALSGIYVAWLRKIKGVPLYEIPYKTAGQTLAGAVSGDVHLAFYTVGATAPLAKAGKIKILAVATDRRSSQLPDVPTFKEAGIDVVAASWYGMFVPAGTPRQIVNKLNGELNKLLADPSMKVQLQVRAGMEGGGGSPEQFAAMVAADRETYLELANAAGIKPE